MNVAVVYATPRLRIIYQVISFFKGVLFSFLFNNKVLKCVPFEMITYKSGMFIFIIFNRNLCVHHIIYVVLFP